MKVPLFASPARRVLVAIVAFCVLTFLWALANLLLPQAGLRLRVFNGVQWAGRPIADSVTPIVSTDVLRRLLRNASLPVSLRWDGVFVTASSGSWTLSITSPDPVTVILDAAEIAVGAGHQSQPLVLSAGEHLLRVRSAHPSGIANLRVFLSGIERQRPGFAGGMYSRRATAQERRARALTDWFTPWVILGWCALVALALGAAIVAALRRFNVDVLPREARYAQGLVLAMALCGIGWGLVMPRSWAPDEILPGEVVRAVAHRFAGGWHSKYPPLHYYEIALVTSPGLAFGTLTGWQNAGAATMWAMALAARLLSIVFALLLVGAVAELSNTLRPGTGGAAALAAALLLPFSYYAKLANSDIPYLLWVVASAVFLLRGLADLRDRASLLALTVTAVLAVTTKDQAYGFYSMVPLLVIVSYVAVRPAVVPLPTWIRTAVLPAIGLGLILLALIYNLPWNWTGARAHFHLITGASLSYRMFPSTIGGHLELAGLTWRLMAWCMSWPGLLLAAAGVALALVDRTSRRATLIVLSMIASYVLSFVHVVHYVYDRFLLGPALLLTPFVAIAIDAYYRHRRGGPARVKRLAIAAVALLAFANAASVEVLMLTDPRYAAKRWLDQRVTDWYYVGGLGDATYLPGINGGQFIPPTTKAIAGSTACVLVANPRVMERFDNARGNGGLQRGLDSGEWGFYEVARFEPAAAAWLPLSYTWVYSMAHESVVSNLDKIAPPIRVYARDNCPALQVPP